MAVERRSNDGMGAWAVRAWVYVVAHGVSAASEGREKKEKMSDVGARSYIAQCGSSGGEAPGRGEQRHGLLSIHWMLLLIYSLSVQM